MLNRQKGNLLLDVFSLRQHRVYVHVFFTILSIPGLYPMCVSRFCKRSSTPGQDLILRQGDDKFEILGPNACASLVVLVSSTRITVKMKIVSCNVPTRIVLGAHAHCGSVYGRDRD